jgi:hypothetical protein
LGGEKKRPGHEGDHFHLVSKLRMGHFTLPQEVVVYCLMTHKANFASSFINNWKQSGGPGKNTTILFTVLTSKPK